MKYFDHDVQKRKSEWTESVRSLEEMNGESTSWRFMLNSLFCMTKLEIVEQLLALLSNISWVISVPFCAFLYRYFLKTTVQRLILTAVTNKHAEQQGMEMYFEVKHAQQQRAFMLDALHQIRREEHDFWIRKRQKQQKAR